jgi:putative endonuclease
MVYFVYILRCSDNTYYTGTTIDVPKRLRAHNHLRSGAKYTRVRRPVVVVYTEKHDSLSAVRKREYEIKQYSRAKKEKLWQY